jgi:hypothetical protein
VDGDGTPVLRVLREGDECILRLLGPHGQAGIELVAAASFTAVFLYDPTGQVSAALETGRAGGMLELRDVETNTVLHTDPRGTYQHLRSSQIE